MAIFAKKVLDTQSSNTFKMQESPETNNNLPIEQDLQEVLLVEQRLQDGNKNDLNFSQLRQNSIGEDFSSLIKQEKMNFSK